MIIIIKIIVIMITIMTITKSAIIMMTVDENYINNKNHQNLEVKKKNKIFQTKHC